MDINNIKVLFSENEIQTRIQELAEEINKDYKGETLCVICVLKGATLFYTDLIKKLNIPLKLEFIRISTYASNANTGKINHLDITLPQLDDENVLIVEDIIDTGFTADFLIKSITLKNKVKSIKFISLLNKKIARKIDVKVDYYGFEIGNQFVLGYGLDYDDLYRNLPFIGVMQNQ